MLGLRLRAYERKGHGEQPSSVSGRLPGDDFDTVDTVVSNDVSVYRRQLARRSKGRVTRSATAPNTTDTVPAVAGTERRERTCVRISERRAWRAARLKMDAIRIVREIRRDMGDELSKGIAACGYRERARFVRDTKTPHGKHVSGRFFAVPLGDWRRKTGCGKEIESRLGGERETSINTIVVRRCYTTISRWRRSSAIR